MLCQWGESLLADVFDFDARMSDEELLQRLQAGEHDLFGTLVRRYERELYGYLHRYLGDAELAADVFQNTWVQVFVKIGQYQKERAARPWIYAIATNQSIDAMRRRARRPDMRAESYLNLQEGGEVATKSLFEVFQVREAGPPEQAEAGEMRELVRQAVEQLPELLRQVVLLAYFQGLRYQEIADVLDIPLGTVKSRLHAALARLTEIWNEMTATEE
jgi:RNA polymerase sigma-70 factor, ECF subfamily